MPIWAAVSSCKSKLSLSRGLQPYVHRQEQHRRVPCSVDAHQVEFHVAPSPQLLPGLVLLGVLLGVPPLDDGQVGLAHALDAVP